MVAFFHQHYLTFTLQTYHYPEHHFRSWSTQVTSPSHIHTKLRVHQRGSNDSEEDLSSSKLESIRRTCTYNWHPSRAVVKPIKFFMESSQSYAAMLTHYSTEPLTTGPDYDPLFLILSLASDVHPNPGPPGYPCSV